MNNVYTSLDDIDKKYQVIYADPPWRYNFSKSKSRKIENQYPTMELDEIKNLNVPSSDNSILFLWSTAPKLREALEVMDAWGFDYKTNIVWDKVRIGMGYWFRGQHENILVGVKGNFLIPDKIIFLPVISIKRGYHSKKPDFFRNLIFDLFPDFNKIELFAIGVTFFGISFVGISNLDFRWLIAGWILFVFGYFILARGYLKSRKPKR